MKWFVDLKIVTKFVVGIAIFLFGMAVIGYTGFRSTRNTQRLLEQVFDSTLPAVDYLVQADRDLHQLLVAERSMIFTSTQSQEFKKLVADYEENLAQAQERWNNFKALAVDQGMRESIDGFDTDFARWQKVSQTIVDARVGDTREGRRLAIDLSLGEAAERFETMREHLNVLQEQTLAFAEAERAAAVSAYKTATATLYLVMGAALLVGIAMAWFLGRTITTPIRRITEISKTIAKGDLRQDESLAAITQQDELGELAAAFRAMGAALRGQAEVADRIANGDLRVEVSTASADDVLGHAMARMKRSIEALVDDTSSLVSSALAGELTKRADASAHEGEFRRIIEGVNETLDALLGPITEASRALEALAGYDLRARVQGEYHGDHAKIKDSLNATAGALHEALTQVAEAVDQVSTASTQIARSSQQVAEGASQQASALEETSSSLEEMASMTRQNADNTQQAKALAVTTRAAAETGSTAMTQMLTAMDKIRAAADSTAQIIRDINEIAFQTNLLALNAAVEAARAGDAGRGFAVVAEEVRNLAQRAKEAAKKTEELIKESVTLAEEGEVISRDVSGNLTEIVDSVAKVTDIVSEVAVASEEQSRGIEQVNKAVAEMDSVVQQAAANSEESSSAAEELAAQAQELSAMVARFQLQRTLGTERTLHAPARTSMKPASAQRRVNDKRVADEAGIKLRPEEVIPLDDDPDFAEF